MGGVGMESFERARWEHLYQSHAGQVYALAYRRVGREDAADVVAETFLVAWKRIDQVPSEALPWLYTVARNVIGNSRRAEQRREAVGDMLRRSTQVDRSADAVREVEARHDLLSAMQLLPETERAALMLIAWEDLDVRGAACVLGCSPGTLAVRIHRGRRRLKKILANGAFDAGWSRTKLDTASGGMP